LLYSNSTVVSLTDHEEKTILVRDVSILSEIRFLNVLEALSQA
jgi:hypothetical protein